MYHIVLHIQIHTYKYTHTHTHTLTHSLSYLKCLHPAIFPILQQPALLWTSQYVMYHAQAPNAPTTAVHWVKRPCSQLQLKHTTDIYLHFNTICKTSTQFQKVVLLSMDPTYYIPEWGFTITTINLQDLAPYLLTPILNWTWSEIIRSLWQFTDNSIYSQTCWNKSDAVLECSVLQTDSLTVP